MLTSIMRANKVPGRQITFPASLLYHWNSAFGKLFLGQRIQGTQESLALLKDKHFLSCEKLSMNLIVMK